MDTLFTNIKLFGDFFIVPLIGFIAGLCAISPSLGEWIKRKDESMKSSPRKWRILGGLIIVFFMLYFIAGIKERKAEEQSQNPNYVRQIAVKYHAEQISKELYALADEYDKADQSEKMKLNTYLGNKLGYRINEIVNELANEGVHNQPLDQTYFGGMIKDGSQLRAYAKDLKALSEKLPNSQ